MARSFLLRPRHVVTTPAKGRPTDPATAHRDTYFTVSPNIAQTVFPFRRCLHTFVATEFHPSLFALPGNEFVQFPSDIRDRLSRQRMGIRIVHPRSVPVRNRASADARRIPGASRPSVAGGNIQHADAAMYDLPAQGCSTDNLQCRLAATVSVAAAATRMARLAPAPHGTSSNERDTRARLLDQA